MKFQRYTSIENSYRSKFVNSIIMEGLEQGVWIVQEKVHGAHFSMWFNGKDFFCGKRGGFVGTDGSFYNHDKILDKYEQNIRDMYEELAFDLNKRNQKNVTMSVEGEIYGGVYPHPDIERVNGAPQIQKGIWYSPDTEFIAYDVVLDDVLMDEREMSINLDIFKIPWSRTLYAGTFKECLEYPNEFQSTIAEVMHGLPPIDGDNVCEGVVIRPLKVKFLNYGSRVILKNKNEKWAEKAKGSKIKTIPKELCDEAKEILTEASKYITENRLKNVISHIGTVTNKEFGKVLGLFVQDILKDFYIESKFEDMDSISKEEGKLVRKMLNSNASVLVRENFVNIIDGEF